MSGPLEGIRILDLSRLLPGPFCTMILADLGAEVVKIEDPVQGDYVRWIPPYVGKTGARFLALNRNKKSATLNLKAPRGLEIFLELVKHYDVVVEGFRPGVLKKLGADYETASAINPEIIYCSLTGYGQTGPYADRAGHDINYIGYTGVLDMTGPRDGKPVPPGVQVGDIGGALNAVIGVLAALVERNRTGLGRHIDVSLADAAFFMLPLEVAAFEAGDPPPRRGGTRLTGGTPVYGTYETADGQFVCIGAIEPKFFKKFCELTGRMDLEVYHYGEGKDKDFIEKELTALFRTRTRAEWLELLEKEDVCVGPVNTLEQALEDPQIKARGLLIDVPVIGGGGTVKQIGLPFKFSGAAPPAPAAPPDFGEHTAEILAEAGVTEAELAQLRAGGVIR